LPWLFIPPLPFQVVEINIEIVATNSTCSPGQENPEKFHPPCMCSYFWWTTAICRKTFELFRESLLYQLLVHSWVRQIKKAKDNVALGRGFGDQITLLMPNKSIDYVTVASLIKMKCANGNLKPTQAQPPYNICW